MSERLRSVLFGVALGVAPLLLLDLARILDEAILADGGDTSRWWPIACYVATGVVAAVGVAAGRQDRTIPIVAVLVVLLVVLPTVPLGSMTWMPSVPLVPTPAASQAVVFALAGAYAFSAVRGPRS